MPTDAERTEAAGESFDVNEEADVSSPETETSEIAALRRLIVQSEEVGDVLPSAIVLSSQKDSRLAAATLPIVEENIKQSVHQNPDVLAEALFPAIGPAIRKAISEALGQMVQSLNQTLEHSLSPRGLRWRIEAWQTGKPFAEVVMLNSLVYRVEEVFLIHRETGGLLQHVTAKANVSEDADMVSAMLTAIQDFAHDSFKESENATLDSLQLNELSVWIERGPDAILAGVIHGNAPLSLREIFKEAIEAIQFVQQPEFNSFDGDTSRFEKSRPMMDNCLRFQLNTDEAKEKKLLTPTNVIAGLAAILLLFFGFLYVRDSWRWSSYLDRLKKEPGVVVTEVDRGWLTDSISGLRDPSAADPVAILSEFNMSSDKVVSTWKPYLDLSDEMIRARALSQLKPPAGVELAVSGGILNASGAVSADWFRSVRGSAASISGIKAFRLSPDALKSVLESQSFRFKCGTAELEDGEEAKLTAAAADLESLIDSGYQWSLNIVGQTDQTGSDELNSKLSETRAETVANRIKELSTKLRATEGLMTTKGVGTSKNAQCKVDFEAKTGAP